MHNVDIAMSVCLNLFFVFFFTLDGGFAPSSGAPLPLAFAGVAIWISLIVFRRENTSTGKTT